jgi:guanine deaminase
MSRLTGRFYVQVVSNPDRRTFFLTYTATTAAGAAAVAGMRKESARAATPTPTEDQRKFMAEATRLAIESVEKGGVGPFGAVIVKDGQSSAAGRTACC